MKDNLVKEKSFRFAISIVNLYKQLCESKKEFILSKQILRCGTSVGAMVREAEHSESSADFIHKMAIAQKEINETIYWLELLKVCDYITCIEFDNLNNEAVEILKIITAIIKTTNPDLIINH